VFAIQSIMLVSLGFLLAVMLAFIVAPAYWGRAVRLTSERLRGSLPMSEAEIRADKDRLRAQHAISIHKLQTRIESESLSVARQKVDINRRDAKIGKLEKTLSNLNTNLEASENARRVLEHTILDRVPRIEKRLSEARDLISERDSEIAMLQSDNGKTFLALDEAMQINQQQRVEIDRLKSLLAIRHERAVMERATQVAAYEGDLATRSELEALRARTREQASLISKLQGLLRDNVNNTEINEDKKREVLKENLNEIGSDMQAAQGILTTVAANDANAVEENAKAMRELNSKVESQAGEIEKLRAALNVFEGSEQDKKSRSLRDMRIALKARVASLEKETAIQAETIRKLRAELASTNDRSARQAAFHMNELRRLNAGTYPASISARQRADARHQAEQEAKRRRSLAERITEKVPAASADLARTPSHRHLATSSASTAVPQQPSKDALPSLLEPVDSIIAEKNQPAKRETSASADVGVQQEREDANAGASVPKRSRLLERIAGTAKN